MTSLSGRRTPLHALHQELGGQLTDFAGWIMPLRYDSETAEHVAVRERAGLFDLSHMGEIEIAGPEAAQALDHALVSNIAAVGIGKAKYTMMCRDDGGILDDLIVYRLADAHFLIVANAANAEVVLEAMRVRCDGYAVNVADGRDDWALLAIQGPLAAEILSRHVPIDLATSRYYSITPSTIADRPVMLARTGYTGEDGFEIFCRPDDAETLWTMLARAGSSDGLVPAGLACRDTLRLEAGMPLYGHELSVDLDPFQAGLGRIVALDQERDFVGKRALTELSARPVERRLVGVLPAGRRPARAAHPVLRADTGASCGAVTSGAPSPTLGRPIAMAYVDTAAVEADSAIVIDIRGTHVPAEITALPFYRRAR